MRVNIGPKLPLPKCLLHKKKSEPVKKTSQVIKCTSCDFTCQKIRELNDHVKEHIVLNIFTCNNCNYKCTDSLSHEAHIASCLVSSSNSVLDQLIHNKTPQKGLYCCESCSFKFKTEQNLILHENKHIEDKLMKCYICEMGFSSTDKLRNHFKLDHNATEMIFSCNICQYFTMRYHHFKDHKMIHNTDKYLFCSQCKKNFENLTEINEHLNKMHKKAAQRTTSNEEDLIIKSNLTVEEKLIKLRSSFMAKNVLKNEFYQCNGCSYKFLKLDNLLTHKKLHLNVSIPYKCSDCDFESFCVIDIKRHLATHSQPKVTVVCNFCNILLCGSQIRPHAVFHVQDSLFCFKCFENYEDAEIYEKHLNVEHEVALNKVLTCSECSYTHVDSKMLKLHKKRHHCQKKFCTFKKNRKLVPEPNIVKVVFKCNKCNFVFSQIDMLERHDRLNHGGDKDLFLCSVCNWTTSLNKHYLRHMSTHGGKNIFSCCYCQCETYNEKHFVKHVSEHTVKCCPYCVFKCGKFSSLKSHIFRQHKPGKGPFSCSLCPYNTAKKNNLNSHSIMYHPKEFPSLKLPVPLRFLNSSSNGCGLCPYKNDRTNDIKRHVSRHFLNGLFKKKKILDQSASVSVKKENIDGINSTQIIPSSSHLYRCSQCPYSGKLRGNVAKHLFTKHNIHGGIRNNMIMKIDKSLLQNDESKRKKLVNCKENKFNNAQELNYQETEIADSGSGTGLNSQTITSSKKKTSLLKQRFKSSVNTHLHKRKYVCNLCQFSCNYKHGLKRHKTLHFTGGYIGKKTTLKPFTEKIKSKLKSLDSRGIHLVKQEIRQPIKDINITYSCSQCNFKSLDIKVVTHHLLDIHNIHGNLKNHMVKKIIGKLTQEVSNSLVLNPENGINVGKLPQKNQPSKSDKLTGVKTLSTGPKVKKMRKRIDEKCFQCNIHLLSAIAQFEHKRLGHEGFWNKPFSCTRPNCGVRFTTKTSLVRHEIRSCEKKLTLKNIKTSEKKITLNNVKSEQQKEIKEHCSIKEEIERPVSDDESFSCGECDYITFDVTDLIKHMFVHTGIADD